MNLKPDALESNGYIQLDKLEHMELVPFVRTYINKRTRFSNLYMLSNLLIFGSVGYLLVSHFKIGTFTMSEGLVNLSYGLAIAFLLLPLHEFIHVLAYRSQGAEQTSYDANLKKFYFMALADNFVANKREFEIVALAPFTFITTTLIIFLFVADNNWNLTISSVLLAHTAMCSGDFGLLSFFDFHKDKEPVTYDEVENKISYFYGKISETKTN